MDERKWSFSVVISIRHKEWLLTTVIFLEARPSYQNHNQVLTIRGAEEGDGLMEVLKDV